MTDPTRDRASSAKIIATWPYAPAGDIARNTTHKRYLGRHRSSQSEELTTRTCISPARCAPRKMTDATRDRASSAEINSPSLYSPASGMARKTTHERYLGRRRSSRSEELTTNGASPRRGAHPKMTNYTEIARAQLRSTRLHVMPSLMALIENQLMRGIWAAVDRPSPTN